MTSHSKWIVAGVCGIALMLGLSTSPAFRFFKSIDFNGFLVQTLHSGQGFTGVAREIPYNGFQTWISPKGNLYMGIWKNGNLPSGTLITDKSVYEGELQDLAPHGFGIMYYNNGDIYKGNWSYGFKNGIGLKHNRDGSMYFGRWDDGTYNAPKDAHYNIEDLVYGIDLSKYQHPDSVKWKDLALYADSCGEVFAHRKNKGAYMLPITFALIKSTQGGNQDPFYKRHIAEARKHKVIVGSYHFFTIDDDIDTQINNFIKNTQWEKGDVPPILDIESEYPNNQSAYIQKLRKYGIEKMQKNALKWLGAIEKNYHVKPIIYSSDKWKKDFLDNKDFDRYELWISRYHNIKPEHNKRWLYWQRTDSAYPHGYHKNMDVSVFKGSYRVFVQNRNSTY